MYVLCVFLSSCRSLFIFISLFTISFVFVFFNRPSFYHTNTNDTMTSPPWRLTSLVGLIISLNASHCSAFLAPSSYAIHSQHTDPLIALLYFHVA
jgi:hypothetical protein